MSAGALKLDSNTSYVQLYSNGTLKAEVSSTGLAVTGALSTTGALTTNGIKEDAAGNLGLGVVPSAGGATTNFEIGPYGATIGARNNASAPQLFISSNAVGTAYTPIYKISGKATQYVMQGLDGSHSWLTAPSGTAGAAITFTQAMTLDASGNLLVGVASGVYSQISKARAANAGNPVFSVDGGNNHSFVSYSTSGFSPNAANASVKFGHDATTGRGIASGGTGNFSGADYAEYERNGGLTITKGSIIGFKADGTLTNIFADAIRFAIKSTNPSLVGGDTWGSEDQVGNPKRLSLHRVTLQDALDQGFLFKLQQALPVDAEQQAMDEATYFDFVKSGCADQESFDQEYGCVPADDDAKFLEYGLITACEYSGGTDWQRGLEGPFTGRLFCGVDIGRKKDLTVLWVVEQLGDVFYTRHVETMEKMRKSAQEDILWPWFEICDRICIDATGLGIGWSDDAQDRFSENRVEAVTFTGQVKEALAYPLRGALEDRAVRIPDDAIIRSDLRKVQKVVTAAGNIRFVAESTSDGHADRFWALALALHAGSDPSSPIEFTSSGQPRGADAQGFM